MRPIKSAFSIAFEPGEAPLHGFLCQCTKFRFITKDFNFTAFCVRAQVPPDRVQGKRIVVFVVGGITRSEMRVAHTLSKRHGRDIVLGGTSIDTPDTFLKNLLVRNPPAPNSA